MLEVMATTKKPLIGITCGEVRNKTHPWSPVVHGQSRTYVRSIIAAGGVPVLLPVTANAEVVATYCSLLDGLLLAGGNDIHPSAYGQAPDGEPGDYSPGRDTSELMLLDWAMRNDKPILGICRGMQLLNVYCGGTLHQDIKSRLPDKADHNASTKLQSLIDFSHLHSLDPASRLAQFIGPEPIGTNEHHHQAIDELGQGVSASAWAADGIIEAIEVPGRAFAVGVQSHPESLTKVMPRWKGLFTAFVTACG
jgi:putative glutamine amidotransferase